TPRAPSTTSPGTTTATTSTGASTTAPITTAIAGNRSPARRGASSLPPANRLASVARSLASLLFPLPVRPMKKLFYVLLFGVVLYFAVLQAREMGDSRSWPSTEGVITASRLDSRQKTSTEKGFRGDRYEYEVKVTYSYRVDGV